MRVCAAQATRTEQLVQWWLGLKLGLGLGLGSAACIAVLAGLPVARLAVRARTKNLTHS